MVKTIQMRPGARFGGELALLAALTALTRYVLRSHYLYDIDSVNFALALERFDPVSHQPHPPGYFLYVCLGRLSRLVFQDTNSALVALSVLFSCGAVVVIALLAAEWHGRAAARFAGLIFLFSPLAWFHGTVALTYIVEAFFSALTGFLCWRARTGGGRWVVAAAVTAGVGAGFRPSSLLLLGPLLLLSLERAGAGLAAAGLAALGATVAAWFLPMTIMSGGSAWASSLWSLWTTVAGKTTAFNSSPLNSLARAVTIAAICGLAFGGAALLPLAAQSKNNTPDHHRNRFLLVWIAPGLLFFTFVFLKFVNSGYLLVLFPPVCVWMGAKAASWYANGRPPAGGKAAAVALCAVFNTLLMLYAPIYCSYGSVRRFEKELEQMMREVPRAGSPATTMIVGFDSHFLGYRHAGYYLPAYTTVQFPAVQLAAGKRVFTMRGRDTKLEPGLPEPAAQRFVFFPLPGDDAEYGRYAVSIRKRFAAGRLRSEVHGGVELITGQSVDLGGLFRFPVAGK